jgi:ABC-type branched-subunit amino acid transport system substrate-binding protein/outer membrane protein assembly factor BamD (BamD/ComL family)
LYKKLQQMIKENPYSKIYIIAAIILSACSFSYAQQNKVENEFKLALDLYKSGRYDTALTVFKNIAFHLPSNHETPIADLFVGKTYLKLNDLTSSKKYLRDFLAKYPESGYRDEAHLALADVFYKQKNYRDAFEEILYLVSKAELPGYKDYAESTGYMLAINELETNHLETIKNSTSDLTLKPYLLFLLGKKQESLGNFNLAAEAYQEVIDIYPNSGQSKEAKEDLKTLASKKAVYKSNNLIGVLLPLTDAANGGENTVSKEILEGIKYAAWEYNQKHDVKVGLIIRDTKGDTSTIKNIAGELSIIPAVKAVIGPIFSDEVRSALNYFRGSGIPLVSPTATDDDLVELSDYFFQANPAFFMRAKVMAQYIYFVTGKRKIALLNADKGYSPLLASIFEDEFKKLGGEIVDKRTYTSGSLDLINPVSAIAADSLRLEGIYIPLSDKLDSAPLLSQMVQQGINTAVFGNQDWFYAKGFESSSALSNQLSFTSDFFIDYNDTLFSTFSKNFSKQTGIDINRNVLYGYDTADYLLTLINAGAVTRSSLISSMESGIEVEGYHNNIAFGKKHINLFINIVQYRDGKFELVERFKSGE